MFISANGIVTRTPIKGITVQGRSTQGVRLMRVTPGDEVVALALMEIEESEKKLETAARAEKKAERVEKKAERVVRKPAAEDEAEVEDEPEAEEEGQPEDE